MARPADSKSGDRQPHAARRSPRQGATADHLTRSEHSSFRAAYGFAAVRPKRVSLTTVASRLVEMRTVARPHQRRAVAR